MSMALETLDDIRLSERSTLSDLLREDGHRPLPRRQHDPAYRADLARTADLVTRVLRGDRWAALQFAEAMSTADFPGLFGNIMDRVLLGGYQAWPATWPAYAKRGTVPDFRQVTRVTLDGAEGQLPEVLEGENYTAGELAEGAYAYRVRKFGKRLPFTWEVFINDDLDAFRDVPLRFGRSAARSEQRFITTLYVDASGPHAAFYNANNRNIVNAANSGLPFTANNPPLGILGLQQAMAVLSRATDTEGEPVMVEAVTLVVPIALEMVAQNILNSTELRIGAELAGGGTANTLLVAQNWMRNRVTLVVDPYISNVASTANGGTSWFLFANPNVGRPALEVGFLRGHETPEIWMKSPNAVRVGGGAVSPFEGDFDTDSIQYRVRHIFGGTRLDPKMTVASNGSGA